MEHGVMARLLLFAVAAAQLAVSQEILDVFERGEP